MVAHYGILPCNKLETCCVIDYMDQKSQNSLLWSVYHIQKISDQNESAYMPTLWTIMQYLYIGEFLENKYHHYQKPQAVW